MLVRGQYAVRIRHVASIFRMTHIGVRLSYDRSAGEHRRRENLLLIVVTVVNHARPVAVCPHVRPDMHSHGPGQTNPLDPLEHRPASLEQECIHRLDDSRIFGGHLLRIVDVVDQRYVLVRFDQATHLVQDFDKHVRIPLMIPIDQGQFFRSVVLRAFTPGQRLARNLVKAFPAPVTVADFHPRPEIMRPPGIEVYAGDIVVPHDVLHEIHKGLPIGCVPANRSVIFTDKHMAALRPAPGTGSLGVFGVILRDHGPGEFVAGRDIRNDPDTARLARCDYLGEQIPVALIGMPGKSYPLNRGILTHRGHADRIDVHLRHGSRKGLGVELHLGRHRRIVRVDKKDPCALQPIRDLR